MTFPCGHERTPENSMRAGRTRRCKICQVAAIRRAVAKRMENRERVGRYQGKDSTPLAAPNSTTNMELASETLLRAIWKHHKRIMLVAEACGRQVERP